MRAARGAGPGAFDFRQGDTNGTAFWRLVRHFIHEPSAAQAACHAPKPILLDTGSLNIPYAWCEAASCFASRCKPWQLSHALCDSILLCISDLALLLCVYHEDLSL